MRRPVLILLALSVLIAGAALTAGPAQAAPPRFANLDPGGPADLRERVPVNVVLVGYDRDDVSVGRMRAGLAKAYEPVVRSRLWYDTVEKLGIRYTYDYDVSFAGRAYENRFFGRLKQLARRAPVTDWQASYNAQDRNAVEVTRNYEIPAPAVEKWLADNAPRGVDTRRNTIYLVNWYERSDFRFHVYTKTNEPDPDTGYNFGNLSSRKVTAWGGTTARDEENGLGSTRRVWFHDISAGPELFAGSWNVDDADLDDDGAADYRIPPIWEYGRGRYRPARALSADLARIVRYVGLNLLMTSSPLYPVELPTPEPPLSVNLDVNVYEGRPGVDASQTYIDPGLLTSELRELLAFNRLSYDSQDLPYADEARRCYEALIADVSCYPELGYPPFANLYLQNTLELARTQDDQGRVDYELPIFAYSVPDPIPALGFADDNYVDGTQSYVFAFLSPDAIESGYGLTTTLIHEVGHHVGLSHPHDGYDSASGVDYEPTGDYYFAWLGDYSNTMMSYVDLNWDFSQFDADNLRRFQTASYVEATNRLAAAALAGPRPERATALLQAADRAVGRSEAAFRRHRYAGAQAAALAAYYLARRAAERAGVDVVATEEPVRTEIARARAARTTVGSQAVDSLTEGPRSAR